MAILWLDKTSGPTIDALNRGYEIGNPKAGDDTHLIDHTWLALVASAGITMVEYTFVRQAENWSLLQRSWRGGADSGTIDFSVFEDALAFEHEGATMIVEVEHTPGRMTSDKYAEGESVTMLSTAPIHASLNSLESDVLSLTSDKEALKGQVSTLESTIGDLTSRLEVANGLQDTTSESRIYRDDNGQTRTRAYDSARATYYDVDDLMVAYQESDARLVVLEGALTDLIPRVEALENTGE